MYNSGMTTTKCLRCGRTLRAASSIKASYGRVCRARIRAAALARALRDFSAAQVEKAREAVADGALVRMRNGVWQAASSDGSSTYLVAWTTCNCPAGLHGRLCYHVAAARMIAAKGAGR